MCGQPARFRAIKIEMGNCTKAWRLSTPQTVHACCEIMSHLNAAGAYLRRMHCMEPAALKETFCKVLAVLIICLQPELAYVFCTTLRGLRSPDAHLLMHVTGG